MCCGAIPSPSLARFKPSPRMQGRLVMIVKKTRLTNDMRGSNSRTVELNQYFAVNPEQSASLSSDFG